MKNSLKIIIFLLMLLSIFFVLYKPKEEQNRKVTVTVSTFALYDIVKHIADETVNIVTILPFGVDPHEYEPTPKTMREIEKSALFFYSGAGLEPWIHGLSFKQKSVDMSQFVSLREIKGDEEEHEAEHIHHHDEGKDPHYWLDFQNMKKMTAIVRAELIKIMPEHKVLYLKNSKSYLQMLNQLDDDFRQTLSTCSNNAIIMNHNAFGYLGAKYNFHIESLSGLSPDSRPNAKNIIKLIETIKEHNVSTIFFESFVSDKAMQGIASETNASVDVALPLANISAKEAAAHASYEQLMRVNLSKLQKALSCH